MERADKDLAFMLQYENIAWYEKGKVRILDRRIYPIKVQFVICKNHREVVIKLPEAKPVKEIMSMDYFESIMRRIKNG